MTLGDLTKHSNLSLEVVVRTLVFEDFLTEEQGKKILSNYAMIVVERGFWGRIWDKLFDLENKRDFLRYQLVKVCHVAEFGIPIKEEDESENDLEELAEDLNEDL
jgi:hypothetical protein